MLKEKIESQHPQQKCRNILDVKSDNGIEIDAGSLWCINDGYAELVDADQYVRVLYDEKLFYLI